MVTVNFIRENGMYMKQLEFAEAPLIGDEVDLSDGVGYTNIIYVVTKRMWRSGGKAIDCYLRLVS